MSQRPELHKDISSAEGIPGVAVSDEEKFNQDISNNEPQTSTYYQRNVHGISVCTLFLSM